MRSLESRKICSDNKIHTYSRLEFYEYHDGVPRRGPRPSIALEMKEQKA